MKLLHVLAGVVSLVLLPTTLVAQSTTSTSSAAPAINTAPAAVPACSLSCTIANAINSTCMGIGNLTCLCTNAGFQMSVQRCFNYTCSPTDLTAALLYGNYTCAAIGYPINVTLPTNGTNSTNTTMNSTMLRRAPNARRNTVQLKLHHERAAAAAPNSADPTTRMIHASVTVAVLAFFCHVLVV